MKFYLAFAVLALVSSINIRKEKKAETESDKGIKKEDTPIWTLRSVLDHQKDRDTINAYMQNSTERAEGRPFDRSNGKEFEALKPLGWDDELKEKKAKDARLQRANKYKAMGPDAGEAIKEGEGK